MTTNSTASTSRSYRSVNPATVEVVSEHPRGTADWRNVPIEERAAVRAPVAEPFAKRVEELAKITTEEVGNPLAEAVDSDMIYVNAAEAEGAEMPFGGVKRSGYGREFGPLGMDEFVNKRLLYIAE